MAEHAEIQQERKPLTAASAELAQASEAVFVAPAQVAQAPGIVQQKAQGSPSAAVLAPPSKGLQAMVNNSPQTQQAAQFQAMANHTAHRQAPVIQQKPVSAPASQAGMAIQLASASGVVQRVESDAARNWRKFKRWLSRKSLPDNTYRWDTRDPAVIAGVGFQPWDPSGIVSLKEHVRNSDDTDGHAVKYESQWVSTGAFGMLKKIDPTFAQQVNDTNLYKIDTAIAQANSSNKFVDVNKHFDGLKIARPYASQKEWSMEGDGIHPSAVVEWMPGGDYINQYDFKKMELSVGESSLAGWRPMPPPAMADSSDDDSGEE